MTISKSKIGQGSKLENPTVKEVVKRHKLKLVASVCAMLSACACFAVIILMAVFLGLLINYVDIHFVWVSDILIYFLKVVEGLIIVVTVHVFFGQPPFTFAPSSKSLKLTSNVKQKEHFYKKNHGQKHTT